ncbi:MAG: hypothetical protein MUF85_00690 [Patescibacteria group bacterium]|jgi:predicted kinase|nr:hypothetical protein [Patescibacteria group bacterium]
MIRPELDPRFDDILKLPRPLAITTIGLPGTGRTELALSLSDLLIKSEVVDMGEVRSRLCRAHQGSRLNKQTWEVAFGDVARIMDLGKIAILVTSNTGPEQRRININKLRELGAITVVGYYLMVHSPEEAYQRKPRSNKDRLRKMYGSLSTHPPSVKDGFDILVELDAFKPYP